MEKFRKKLYAMLAAATGSIYCGGPTFSSESQASVTEQKHVPVELIPSEHDATLDDYFKADQNERRKSLNYVIGRVAAESEKTKPLAIVVQLGENFEKMEFVSAPARGIGLEAVPRDRVELQEAITNLEAALKPYEQFVPRSQADRVRALSERWLAYTLALRDTHGKASTDEKKVGYSVIVDDYK